MYRFAVSFVLKNNRVVQGVALQTTYNSNREECIVLETSSGAEEIVLDQVISMEAVSKNPHFEKIIFG